MWPSMNVIELFASIDGEGTRQGYLATFLRLYDCNLRCTYCDTTYSYGHVPYDICHVAQVATDIIAKGNTRLTVTGGEPLLQEEDLRQLFQLLPADYDINIETNGSRIGTLHEGDDRVFYTYDYKCPDSGFEQAMHPDLFKVLRPKDALKFVVSSTKDLDRMRQLVTTNKPQCHLFVSPVFGRIEPKDIVAYMQRYNLQNIRLQLQIHKFIWDPNQKGV